MKVRFSIRFSGYLFIIALLSACHNDELPKEDEQLPATQRLNKFVSQTMKDIYYWAEDVKGRNIDFDCEPGKFLEQMKSSEDSWSVLLENNIPVRSLSDGKKTGMGYELQFYSYNNHIFAMILYIYPSTPADKAGLKRGDMIVKNNEALLTEENYRDVTTASSVNLQLGELEGNSLRAYGPEYKLQAETFETNPIYLDTLIEIAGKKIGYLFYTQFIDNQKNSLDQLNTVIGKFKRQGVNEFILDLRYNTGGAVSAAKRLCSLLAPADIVRREELLITKTWNDRYQAKYENTKSMVEEHFEPAVLAENLDLQHIFFLVSTSTASAAELVISGLNPYLSETIIGARTVGKYAGSVQCVPEEDDLKAWELYPIVFAYKNANGESVKGGISPSPDNEVKEYSNYLFPIGDLQDPLLGKAISLITGQQPVSLAAKAAYPASGIFIPLKNPPE